MHKSIVFSVIMAIVGLFFDLCLYRLAYLGFSGKVVSLTLCSGITLYFVFELYQNIIHKDSKLNRWFSFVEFFLQLSQFIIESVTFVKELREDPPSSTIILLRLIFGIILISLTITKVILCSFEHNKLLKQITTQLTNEQAAHSVTQNMLDVAHEHIKGLTGKVVERVVPKLDSGTPYLFEVQDCKIEIGLLYLEKANYEIAYEYFLYVFELFNAPGDPREFLCLKFMVLCKIMVNQAEDVLDSILTNTGLNCVGDFSALKAVADAISKKSVKILQKTIRDYKTQLEEDPIVYRHLYSLYDTLLEQNLCKVIELELSSRVQIDNIAERIELPVKDVKNKFSQMISNKKFAGILDEGGCLIIFDDVNTDGIFPATLETIAYMGKVVGSPFLRALPATKVSLIQAQEAKNASESIFLLCSILEDTSSSPEALRIKDHAISNLSDLLRQEKRGAELRSPLTLLRPFFPLIPKGKTAKIVREIIDAVAEIPGTSDLQISLCREMVEWTRAVKLISLSQRVEARLATLLMEDKEYPEALTILSGLVKEVRRLDDKLLLVDIVLLESKLHFSLGNLPKAKAALTAAKTAANAIYVPPAQQGTIDLQSGILHAEEKDYKAADKDFFKAFEAFKALEDPRAIVSLKYMLMCKIMIDQADDIAGIISSKAGLHYVGVELEAMKAVAYACSKRSLTFFKKALGDYKAQLEEDPIVRRHILSLYTLLEQNICRLIEPSPRVEIDCITELIELPVKDEERKLSDMILDKQFAGTLDQGLIVFDDPKDGCNPPSDIGDNCHQGKSC